MFWFWIGLAVTTAVLLGVAYYGSTQITLIPYLAVPYTPKDFGWTFEDISFVTEDGLRLTGWWVPAKTSSDVTLIILHGVGSNAGDMLEWTACLQGPWNLLYFNFRG